MALCYMIGRDNFTYAIKDVPSNMKVLIGKVELLLQVQLGVLEKE